MSGKTKSQPDDSLPNNMLYFSALKGDIWVENGDEIFRRLSQIIESMTTVGYEQEAALTHVGKFLFSEGYARERAEIVRKAENINDPDQYCLGAIRNHARDAARKAHSEKTEGGKIQRKVRESLQKLRQQKIVTQILLNIGAMRKMGHLWALSAWNGDHRSRNIQIEVENISLHIRPIDTNSGKGVFEYAKVLPKIIPEILELHNVPMHAKQITDTVISLLPRPIDPDISYLPLETQNIGTDYFLPDNDYILSRIDDLKKRLSDNEILVMELKMEGISDIEIAEKIERSREFVRYTWLEILRIAERLGGDEQ